MPPKTKITKDMILDAAFQIARRSDWKNINARNLAEQLNCSTQPIMYHFKAVEDIKKATYEKADQFHTEYLMDVLDASAPMLEIGLNYIRFAIREPFLFRFLFQSDYGPHTDLSAMVNSSEAGPLLRMMMRAMGTTLEKTKEIFETLAIFTHGYASLLANHYMEYDEATASKALAKAYYGAIAVAEEKEK